MVAPGVIEETDNKTYFRIIYYMPKQALLTVPKDLMENGIRDECISRAYAHDFMPIGEPWVEDPVDAEPDTGSTTVQLQEGVRLDPVAFTEGFSGRANVHVDMMKIVVEVMIG